MLISHEQSGRAARGTVIFVEGLPGTGKSSTAQRIWRQLRMNNVNARWYHESVTSPLTAMDSLERLAFRTGRLAHRFIRIDLEEALHWWLSRRSWARFGSRSDFDGDVLVFDARVFMGLVRYQLSRDVDPERIKARVLRLLQHVRPHAPILVFLIPADIERLIRSTIATRGPAFEEKLLSVTACSPYGRSRGISGFQAVVRYWEDYLTICRHLVESWPGPHIVTTTDVDRASRQRAYEAISNFLGLPAGGLLPDPSQWLPCVGRYASIQGVLSVTLQDGELTILGELRSGDDRGEPRSKEMLDGYLRALTVYPRRRPLMARGGNEFDVDGLPFVASFSSEPPYDLTLSAYLQDEQPSRYHRLNDAGSGTTS